MNKVILMGRLTRDPEINGNMVDTETGEIKEDGVIDLRGAKQA